MSTFPNFERTGKYAVKPMFRVDEVTRPEFGRPRQLERIRERAPALGLFTRLLLLPLNALCLFWVALALGTALFSHALTRAVTIDSLNLAASIPPDTTSRMQAISGVNATLWNLRREAQADWDQLVAGYTAAGRNTGNAAAAAASNASVSLVMVADSILNQVLATARDALDALQRVDQVLAGSDLFTNISTSNVSIPGNISFSSQSELYLPLRGLNLSSNWTVAPILDEAVSQLTSLNIGNQSVVDWSEFSAMQNAVSTRTRSCVAVFSVFAALSLLPAAATVYIAWHREFNPGEINARGQYMIEILTRLHQLLHSRVANGPLRWLQAWMFSTSMTRILSIAILLALMSICNSNMVTAVHSHTSKMVTDASSLHNSEFNAAVNNIMTKTISELIKMRGTLIQELSSHVSSLVASQSLPVVNVTVLKASYQLLAVEQANDLTTSMSYNTLPDTDLAAVSSLASLNTGVGVIAGSLVAIYVAFALGGGGYTWYRLRH